MKTNLFASVALLAVAAAGCSVQHKTVVNEPPVIKKDVVKYDVETGTIDSPSVDVLFWPAGLDEEGTRKVVREVRGASIKIDEVRWKVANYPKLIPSLAKEFAVNGCVEFAESSVDQGMGVPWVTKWKALEPVSAVQPVGKDDPQYPDYLKYKDYVTKVQLLSTCQGNQTKRDEMFRWLSEKTGEAEAGAAKMALVAAVGLENIKSVSSEGSRLEITHSAEGIKVGLTLKDFLLPGVTPSNLPIKKSDGSVEAPRIPVLNATYLMDRKLLAFGIPEIGANGPTGNYFECYLERGPDFLGQARFSGELRLKKQDGTTLRNGSISISGPLVPEHAN